MGTEDYGEARTPAVPRVRDRTGRIRRYWDGWPVYECRCGFETLDELKFVEHIKKQGHEPREDEYVQD